MKKLTGIRPTGKLHIGHYLAVIKPAMENKCDVLIADYHSYNGNIEDMVAQLKGYGLSPIIQSDIFNPKLYFELLNVTPSGDLNRMTQYKSSNEKTAHLFAYPVLMAHDLADYDEVYIGEDQLQHIELARKLLRKVNRKCPKAVICGGRVMDLKNPEFKMSKSKPETCLFLGEDPTKKIMKANTNELGLNNLKFLYRKFVGNDNYPDSNKELKEELIKEIKKI